MTIGKIAEQAGTTIDAVRYYEEEGLLLPTAKSGSGYRLYDAQAVRRLRFIRRAIDGGFTLAEVRALLEVRQATSACCGDVRKLAIEKKLQIEGNIRALKVQSAQLDELIADCTDASGTLDECPILDALDRPRQG
ncbi:MAG: heavy metal-responsive transcriptional regulator [Rudaea sp.]|nr:heavy metal-responsive transcriptional regulator [Rudaea sp.]